MKHRTLHKILLAFLACSFLFVNVFLGLISKVYAYNETLSSGGINFPTGKNVIANIYDDSKAKFLENKLNALAKLVKDASGNSIYGSLSQMITAVENGATNNSADFGETIVYFGKNAVDNSEIAWIPAYLSNSSDGPVLTLWLANAKTIGGEQEFATWSDGTYNNNANTSPSSDNYSTSMIRVKTLNNGGTYYGGYNNADTVCTPSSEDYSATSNGTNKFEMYTTGVLSSFIVTPSAVDWQKNENKTKNDPEWAGNNLGSYTPKDWLNDKLWLPSLYEVYDGMTIADNSVAATSNAKNNGGLWGMSTAKQSNDTSFWLRSSYPTFHGFACNMKADGNYYDTGVNSRGGVRPALHLNLVKALADAVLEHEHIWQSADNDGWVVTTPTTCVSQGEEERVCTAADCTLTGGKETRKIAIDPTAHDFTGAPWKSDGTNHWHECTRTGCTATDTPIAHTKGAAATCTTAQACTVCDHELVANLGHDWDTKWSSGSSGHWHQCLRAGCTEKNDSAAHNPDRAAADCDHAQVCTVCSFEMAAKLGHDYSNNVVLPTCESGGYTEHVCSNCGDSYQDNIVAANGHSWGSPVWQWAGNYLTCKAKFTCTTCSKEQTETCAVAHSSATASCTVAGDTTHTASVTFGGNPYSDSQVESGTTLPHTWVLLNQTVAPDCENDGAGDFECSVCHKTETRPIDKLGHDPVDDAAIPATCDTDGRAAGKHCSRCNKTLEGLTVINALGHDWGAWVETKPATYTEDGEEKRECQRSGCTHFETNVIPMKVKVAITVTIQPASSEVGAALETLTATVTTGTLIDPADMPYTLSTDADINTMGTYTITGVCTDERYNITFIEGVYIVSKKADDPNGGGEIDLPVDINVEFKVTQSSTNNDYSDLDGMKQGYWAQLWYRNEDGTLGDEFTDKMNCILTLKIPTEIIEAIRGGEEINREKIENELLVYYFVDGQRYKVDNFAIAMRDDESWQIKFNYNAKFRAEVVFNAAAIEEPTQPAAAIPWWVWLIVGLAGAAVVGVVVVIFVVAKKKNSAAVAGGAAYDDAELRAQLIEQDKKLDEIREIVDGGFNDIVDDE